MLVLHLLCRGGRNTPEARVVAVIVVVFLLDPRLDVFVVVALFFVLVLGRFALAIATGVRRAFLGGEGAAGASADAVERVLFAAGIVDLSLRGEEELFRC